MVSSVKIDSSFCGRYGPFYVSRLDTPTTIRAARVYNAMYQYDCGVAK